MRLFRVPKLVFDTCKYSNMIERTRLHWYCRSVSQPKCRTNCQTMVTSSSHSVLGFKRHDGHMTTSITTGKPALMEPFESQWKSKKVGYRIWRLCPSYYNIRTTVGQKLNAALFILRCGLSKLYADAKISVRLVSLNRICLGESLYTLRALSAVAVFCMPSSS